MEPVSCPRCGAEMLARSTGTATVQQCPAGHGVFLSRADLGTLVEAEIDWHSGSGNRTAPLPRITADMTAPPAPAKRSRAWVETLFD